MARVSIDEMILKDTADAIRAKGGDDELMSPTSFASAIKAIPTTEVTIDKTLTQEDQAAEAKAAGDAIAAEAAARAEADTALQQRIAAETAARTSAVNAEITNRESGDTLLQTQIDQIIAPSGEAPSAAEVENARIDVDGEVHATLGEAIREQVGNLKSAIFSIINTDAVTIPDNTDFDTLTTTGNYKVSSIAHAATMVNAPTIGASYRVLVFQTTSGSAVFQVAFLNTGGAKTAKIAIRTRPANTWYGWYVLADRDYADDIATTLSSAISAVEEDVDSLTNHVLVRTYNLFDKSDAKLINGYVASNSSTIKGSSSTRSIYIPCKGDTVYTICQTSAAYTLACATTTVVPEIGVSCVYANAIIQNSTINGLKYLQIKTPADAEYLVVYYWNGLHDVADAKTTYLDTLMVREGNTYSGYRDYSDVRVIYPENVPVNTYGIFGISFLRNNANPTVIRVFDADGMIYRQQVGDAPAYSDFDKAFPWCDMRECNVTVDASGNKTVIYSDETGFSRANDTFIEVPAFYFKREVVNGKETWSVSGVPFSGAEIEPWFLNDDGSIEPYRYIGKYEGAPESSGHVSVTGVVPGTGAGLPAYRIHCEGLNYKLMSIEAHLALSHLVAIEYGTLDCQNVNVGVSYYPYSMSTSAWNKPQNVGETTNTATVNYRAEWLNVMPGDTVYLSHTAANDTSDPRTVTAITANGTTSINITFSGAAYEMTDGSTYIFPAKQPTGKTDDLSCVNAALNGSHGEFKYRGIENLYGNVWEFVDNVVWKYATGLFAVGDKETSFDAPYQPDTGSDTATEGWIKTLGYDKKMKWCTLPETVGGRLGRYIPDEWNTLSSSATQIITVSGGWDHQRENGIFCARTSSAMTTWLYGYRAMT